jgi:hypothetical protein
MDILAIQVDDENVMIRCPAITHLQPRYRAALRLNLAKKALLITVGIASVSVALLFVSIRPQNTAPNHRCWLTLRPERLSVRNTDFLKHFVVTGLRVATDLQTCEGYNSDRP